MPINKNAIIRYKILDEQLSSRYHNYSLDDLTEEVNNRLAEMFPDGEPSCIQDEIYERIKAINEEYLKLRTKHS